MINRKELNLRLGGVVHLRGTLDSTRSVFRTRSALQLVGNSLAAFAGRSIYAAEQWAIVLLIARITTPATVGMYGLASAIVTPVFGLFSLDLRALLATDHDRRHRTAEYMGVRLVTASFAVLCSGGGAIALGYSSLILLVVLLLALRKAFEGLSDILFAVMQRHERMDLPARSAVVKAIVSVGVVGLVLPMTHSLPLALGGLMLVSLGILCIYDARLVKKVEPGWFWEADRSRELGLLRQAVPLGLVTALIALQTSLPRYFLAIHQGESVVGHLTVLSHFLIAGAIVNGAFQQSVGPRLAKYFAARRRERFIFAVVVLCGASVGLGLAGLCIVVPFGPAILRLVYGPVYVEFADTLPWLMVAGIASYALGAVSTALTVMRRLASQAVAAALSALVCGVTSWMWVPIHGVKGAVWAIGAAGSANLMVTGFVLVREFLVSGSDLSMKPQRPVLGSNLK